MTEPAPLGDEARGLLSRMLLSHAWRELAAVRMFEDGLSLAPDEPRRLRLAAHAEEERRHLAGVLACWDALSPGEPLLPKVEARLAERPLPRPAGWLELAMAQFLYDRAGYFQIREYLHSSFLPYRALAAAILAEEEEHQDAGADEVVALCAEREVRAAQPIFERWLAVALASFGRPGSPDSDRAIALGLKARAPAFVMADFVSAVRPLAARAGLTFPPPSSLGLELPNGAFSCG